VKKSGLFLVVTALAFGFIFNSCKRINEATDLGDGLIPAVDNINTFESFLTAETDNVLVTDSSKLTYVDDVAIGAITNDLDFGQTQANAYFNISPQSFGAYPFYNYDSVLAGGGLDSVVLSLSYVTSYGDTNSTLNVRVFEMDPTTTFQDTAAGFGIYPVSVPDFPTTGSELGSKSFTLSSLNDSLKLVHKRTDTIRTANVLRIKLNNGAGATYANKLLQDTNTTSPLWSYKNFSNFYNMFKGLAVKADMQGNALGYFALADRSKTALTFYYRVKRNGIIDTASTSFVHGDLRGQTRFGAQANVIRRTPQNGFATYLAMPGTNEDRVYLQSDPGSAGIIRIPALDTMKSRIIYRAELIVPKLSAQQTDIFPPNQALFLAKQTAGDTVYSLKDDLISMGEGFTINLNTFGGRLLGDSTYRFNITRHVQEIISHGEPNTKFRLYLPYEDVIYFDSKDLSKSKRTLHVLPFQAAGRVILGGGSFVNPARRIRLRLIYSNLQ
jgi:hypothetical protein